ncbi:hypothetical protein [Erwinia pyrifoliae]|uniref:hypothetical protein n=1 Tax=Erwinia pyrifoliae TaxID=79967 RepID=UPI0021FF8A2C|nr:hypothetical protein [Erwinia pyrifoliae]UWS29788.1 hypothetical protein NYP81_18370 [Erwinia pyrifoliae]UWS29795.1 hypothetical protein NYP81_18405 [Erwinia pyrifoliae]
MRPRVVRRGVAAIPGGAGCGVAISQPPGSCRPVGLRLQGFMPARLRLSVTARSRSSLLVPVPASFRYPPLSVLPCKTTAPSTFRAPERRSACGLRQPAPGRRPSTAQRAAPRPPALIMTVLTWRCSSVKRWYDAAVQAQTPRPGGSVRGQKGASGSRGYAAAEKAQRSSAEASHHAG